MRNVSAPKDHEDSQAAPQLLRVSLTDGHLNCFALQMESIPDLRSVISPQLCPLCDGLTWSTMFSRFPCSMNTPPGTKLKLLGRVPVNHGFLLLDRHNCKVMGGHVDKLFDAWDLKKVLLITPPL